MKRRQNLLHDKTSLARWGWYYIPYQPSFANFGVVQLLQKAILVASQTFVPEPQLAGETPLPPNLLSDLILLLREHQSKEAFFLIHLQAVL